MVSLEEPIDKKKERLIVFAILTGTFIAMLNASTINIALPSFVKYFQTDLVTVQWVVVGYMLSTGIITPLVGFLGDKYSCRNVFLLGLILFGITSVGCALSFQISLLIFFRLLQGVAGGLMMPVATTIVYQNIAKERQIMTMSVIGMVTCCGFAIGPSIGGGLLTYFGWQSIFWFNLPFVMLTLFLVYQYVPVRIITKSQKFDLSGISLVMVGTVSILLGFSNGASWGWLSGKFLGLVGVGLVSLILFVHRELGLEGPMLNFGVFKYPQFTCGLLMSGCTNIALCLSPFLMAIYLQDVLLMNPLEAGGLLLFPTLIMGLSSPLAGKLASYVPKRFIVVVSMVVLIVSTYELSRLSMVSGKFFIFLWLSLRYAGIGFLAPIVNNYAMSAVPVHLAGHASAMVGWVRQLAGTLSLSIFTSILAVRVMGYTVKEAAGQLSGGQGMAYIQCLAIDDVTFYSLIILIFCFPLAFIFKDQ